MFATPEGTTQLLGRCKIAIRKTLKDRAHISPKCGLVLDRDLNSAHNILKRSTIEHTELEACEVVSEGITMKQEGMSPDHCSDYLFGANTTIQGNPAS